MIQELFGQTLRNHSDFEEAICVILDINLNDGSGIELRHDLKAAGVSVPVIYMTGNEDSCRSQGCGAVWMRRVS